MGGLLPARAISARTMHPSRFPTLAPSCAVQHRAQKQATSVGARVRQIAAHSHLVHSAALLGLAAANKQGLMSKWAGKLSPPLMVAGVLCFSGSL